MQLRNQDASGAQRTEAGRAGGDVPVAFWRRMLRPMSRLPGKLLLLTVLFVMLAEVLIFVPSAANFRINWLSDRLTAAHIAALATEAASGGQVPERVRRELLSSADVRAIAVRSSTQRRLILPAAVPLVIDASFNLVAMDDEPLIGRIGHYAERIRDAVYVFMAPSGRLLRVYGKPTGNAEGVMVEVILNEDGLRAAMLKHALNILILSIIISMIAAALVYAALSRLLVRPMMRISESMVSFAEAPEDPRRIIQPSARTDEIGIAERELADMQTQLAQALGEKNRLAQLGLAVSKINHDLRNMLASAQLMSDRVGSIDDPTVQRFAPKLIASLDRAIDFCNATLKFGRAQEAAPRRAVFDLAALLSEVADGLDLPRDEVAWSVAMPEGLQIDADREHLHRVLNNLVRNALEAWPMREKIDPSAASGQPLEICVSAERVDRATRIWVSDNGPGVPEKARRNLFAAFQGNARPGGTGLGLAISAELVRAHGGTLSLVDAEQAGDGACFEIVIPDRHVSGA